MAHVVVCVDDTDDVTKSTSTGKVAGTIAGACEALGGRLRLGTTRHQLLLSPDVPYTSHNSSMCFEAEVPGERVEELRRVAAELLVAGSVEAADPGLCVAVLPEDDVPGSETAAQIEELIAFGKRAKVVYCSKESAFAVAAGIPWVHLSEHGGTGQGVVGALAGVGLRLGGADGRFRGAFDLPCVMGFGETPGAKKGKGQGGGKVKGEGPGSGTGSGKGDGSGKGNGFGGKKNKNAGQDPTFAPHFALAKDVTRQLARHIGGPVRLTDTADAPIPPDTPVYLEPQTKAVLRGGSLTVICLIEAGVALPLTKALLDDTGDNEFDARVCAQFAWDNDAEEMPSATESCRNCLHRRWERTGFSCMLGSAPEGGTT